MPEEDECCCVEGLRAVMQAGTDQMVGMHEMIVVLGVSMPLPFVIDQVRLIGGFMQTYLDSFQDNHGPIEQAHHAAAVTALLKAVQH